MNSIGVMSTYHIAMDQKELCKAACLCHTLIPEGLCQLMTSHWTKFSIRQPVFCHKLLVEVLSQLMTAKNKAL